MLTLYLRHKFYAIRFYFSGYYGQKCAANLVYIKTVTIGLLLSNLTLSTSSVTLTQNCHDSPPQLYFYAFYGTSQVARNLFFFFFFHPSNMDTKNNFSLSSFRQFCFLLLSSNPRRNT
jgi:hypothetical protein